MKYLRNPASGEVKYTTPLDAKRLARYGWLPATRAEWTAYQQAKIQAAMLRNMPSARHKLGRLH